MGLKIRNREGRGGGIIHRKYDFFFGILAKNKLVI